MKSGGGSKASCASKPAKNSKPYFESLEKSALLKLYTTAKKNYYNSEEGKVIMMDSEFDLLEEIITQKYPDCPQLKMTGAEPEKKKSKALLPYTMPSLDKVKPDTVERKLSALQKPFLLSTKLDGVSAMFCISSTGEKTLYTRGNGREGQDISKFIPELFGSSISFSPMVIRGEIIMKKSLFTEKYATEFANARNMISGFVNRKDSTSLYGATFVAYEVIEPVMQPSDQMKFLKKNNFEVVDYMVKGSEEIISANTLGKILCDWRLQNEYDIDGVVITEDRLHERPEGGDNPSYSLAFKMPLEDQMMTTEVVDVIWSVTKNGTLKPRVQVVPVVIGGSQIEFVSGFNASNIESNGIGKGAKVIVRRSGDVIPVIHEVVERVEPTFPSESFVWDSKKVDILLEDPSSSTEVLIKTLVQRFKVLGTDGLREGIVERLVLNGYDSFEKIVDLTVEKLLKIEGFKTVSATKLIGNLQESIHSASVAQRMVASDVFGKGISLKKVDSILESFKGNPRLITLNELVKVRGISSDTASTFIANLPKYFEFETIFLKK
jgi:DNA ligase (NAD+)